MMCKVFTTNDKAQGTMMPKHPYAAHDLNLKMVVYNGRCYKRSLHLEKSRPYFEFGDKGSICALKDSSQSKATKDKISVYCFLAKASNLSYVNGVCVRILWPSWVITSLEQNWLELINMRIGSPWFINSNWGKGTASTTFLNANLCRAVRSHFIIRQRQSLHTSRDSFTQYLTTWMQLS